MSLVTRSLFCGPLLVIATLPLTAQSPTPAPAARPAPAALHADSLAIVRRIAALFYTGEVDSLIARMAPGALEGFGGRAGLTDGIAQVGARAGDEVSVVEERWNLRNGARQYWRTSKMSLFPGDFLLRINIDGDGRIIGLGMGPAQNAPPVESVGSVLPKP